MQLSVHQNKKKYFLYFITAIFILKVNLKLK